VQFGEAERAFALLDPSFHILAFVVGGEQVSGRQFLSITERDQGAVPGLFPDWPAQQRQAHRIRAVAHSVTVCVQRLSAGPDLRPRCILRHPLEQSLGRLAVVSNRVDVVAHLDQVGDIGDVTKASVQQPADAHRVGTGGVVHFQLRQPVEEFIPCSDQSL